MKGRPTGQSEHRPWIPSSRPSLLLVSLVLGFWADTVGEISWLPPLPTLSVQKRVAHRTQGPGSAVVTEGLGPARPSAGLSGRAGQAVDSCYLS